METGRQGDKLQPEAIITNSKNILIRGAHCLGKGGILEGHGMGGDLTIPKLVNMTGATVNCFRPLFLVCRQCSQMLKGGSTTT